MTLADRFKRLVHHDNGVEVEMLGWDGYPRKVRLSHDDADRLHKELQDRWESRVRAGAVSNGR